jgi:Transposase DDE domain group 1
MRTLTLPEEVEQWSLTTLREKLVKIGARIVRHGRYVMFQLAEVAVPRALFAVRRDPAPDRPAQAKAPPDMSEASKVSSNPRAKCARDPTNAPQTKRGVGWPCRESAASPHPRP